jgi:signal transduction histidine kinase
MEQASTLHLSWLDAVHVPLVVVHDGVIVRANLALEQLCPGVFLPGQFFLTHLPPTQRPEGATLLTGVHATQPLEFTLDMPSRPMSFRMMCARLDDQDERRLVTLTPIGAAETAQRHKEAARDSLLKSLIDHLPLTVFAIDINGIVIFQDENTAEPERMFESQVGRSIYETHAGETEFLEDTRRVLAGETIERERTYNGMVFETYYAPLYDSEGGIIGAVGMGSNITDRLRMQQAAIESNRLRITLQKEMELSELKSKIMRRIAHEFRTPLSTIQLSAQMLDRYGDRLEAAQRSTRIEHILRQTRHITRLLEDIALVIQSQTQRAKINRYDFNLVQLCQSVLEDLRTSSDAQHYWALSIAENVETVCADARLVGIILQNLLSNACKFSESGTVIRLEAQREEGDLVLVVADQGIGILPEDVEHIYEVFYRGSNFDERPGLGLGLGLVHDAVQQHGGTIQLDSTPGVGTTFTIRLPL